MEHLLDASLQNRLLALSTNIRLGCKGVTGDTHSTLFGPFLSFKEKALGQMFAGEVTSRLHASLERLARDKHSSLFTPHISDRAGNTKWGSITIPLTSCLTGLESAV